MQGNGADDQATEENRTVDLQLSKLVEGHHHLQVGAELADGRVGDTVLGVAFCD